MFQLLILTENTNKIYDKEFALAVAFCGLFIFLLQHFLDDIKLLFKKKPLDYCGFKPGDKVTIKYELPDEWGSYKSKIIHDTILDFKYNRKKDIYLIALLNHSHFIEPWTIISIKHTKPKVNHLPGWL
jgi:hypothetical protein